MKLKINKLSYINLGIYTKNNKLIKYEYYVDLIFERQFN